MDKDDHGMLAGTFNINLNAPNIVHSLESHPHLVQTRTAEENNAPHVEMHIAKEFFLKFLLIFSFSLVRLIFQYISSSDNRYLSSQNNNNRQQCYDDY